MRKIMEPVMKGEKIVICLAVAFAAVAASAALKVSDNGDGTFAVSRDGRIVLPRIEPVVTGLEMTDRRIQRQESACAENGKVWNRWLEEKDGRFRFEIVERPDGAVEITVLGCGDGTTKSRYRGIAIELPTKVFHRKPYRILQGNGRKYLPEEGVLNRSLTKLSTRFFCCEGLVFDFNALGPTSYLGAGAKNSIRAEAIISKVKQGGYIIRQGAGFDDPFGGWGGAKLVIREGGFEDYPKLHFFPSYRYSQSFNVGRLVAFGAPKAGGDYTADDGSGWVKGGRPESVVGLPSGAYYSHAKGSGPAVYRFGGLEKGWYIATMQIGNWNGERNRFKVKVGGVGVGEGREIVLGGRRARTISRAVHVTDGKLDFAFDGDWIVSALGYTPLISDQEDFSISRGFWYSKGYEPMWSYRNAFYEKPVVPAVRDEEMAMPDPAALTAAPRREPPAPVELPDVDSEELAWTKDTRMWKLLRNSNELEEIADDEWRRRYFRENRDRYNYNVVMISSMLSRHTSPDERIARGQELIAKYAKDAHDLGMKFVDHIDLTLLWNCEIGFRRLIERLPELVGDKRNGLPSMQLCMNNPEMKRKVFEYLRRDVENGVDGFQLDEGEFWSHGCTCRHCREKFTAETGWILPLDETDESLRGHSTPLAKRWHEWKCRTITNWYIELRRHLRYLKPNLHLSMYTTHWGFEASLPGRGGSSDLIDLGRVINFFGTEVMTRNVMQSSRSLIPHRKMFNTLSLAYDAPLWAWYYSSNQKCNYFAWAVANLCGQCALKSVCSPDPEVPDFEAWGNAGDNMKRPGARQVAEVAVLFSGHSRDWNRGIEFSREAIGLGQELEILHVPYEYIGDMSVNDRMLAKYRVLFLGAAQCLDDGEIAAIRNFAKRGGRVYLREGAGSCDEIGEPRAEPAFRAELADARSGFATMSSAAPFCAPECTPGKVFAFNPDPAAEEAFRSELAGLVKGATVWATEGLPGGVRTALWREKGGDLVIQFLNACGTDIRNGETMTAEAPKVPFPPMERDIVFRLPRRIAACARATAFSPDFSGGRNLEVKAGAAGEAVITLPKELLKAFTLVRISGK